MASPDGIGPSASNQPGAKELTMIRSPSPLSRSQIGLAALTTLLLVVAAGCADKHIGRRCIISNDGGTSDGMGPTYFSVNPLALECPSRLCIKPAQQQTTNTQALCTDECSSDDDCAGGETRDKNNPTDFRCNSGFSCRYAIPNLEGVPLKCKRVCVCKDFIDAKAKDVKPEGC